MIGALAVSLTACALAVACASSQGAVIASSDVALAPGEALLAIHVDTDVELDLIALNGISIEGPFLPGRTIRVVRAAAGAYRWRSVQVSRSSDVGGYYGIRRSRYAHERELDLTIEDGKLNYAGQVIVREGEAWRIPGFRSFRSISFRVRNRSAEAVRALLEEHPGLLDRYELHFAGSSGDPFLEFYAQERARLADSATPDPSGEKE